MDILCVGGILLISDFHRSPKRRYLFLYKIAWIHESKRKWNSGLTFKVGRSRGWGGGEEITARGSKGDVERRGNVNVLKFWGNVKGNESCTALVHINTYIYSTATKIQDTRIWLVQKRVIFGGEMGGLLSPPNVAGNRPFQLQERMDLFPSCFGRRIGPYSPNRCLNSCHPCLIKSRVSI